MYVVSIGMQSKKNKERKVEFYQWQIDQIKRAVDIGRGDYSLAKYVQYYVYDILEGKDMDVELKGFEDDDE